MGGREKCKYGEMLPSTIRAIFCGLSNWSKTNVLISLLESLNGIHFEKVYVYLKSLQLKYRYLENIFIISINEIGYSTFSNNSDIISPSETRPNSIFIFDDMACDKQDEQVMREYFSMGRHANADCFYLCQTYARILKHLIWLRQRDSADLVQTGLYYCNTFTTIT